MDENVTLTTFENVGTDYSLGAEVMLNFDPFDFWNVNLMGNVYNYLVEGVLYEKLFRKQVLTGKLGLTIFSRLEN